MLARVGQPPGPFSGLYVNNENVRLNNEHSIFAVVQGGKRGDASTTLLLRHNFMDQAKPEVGRFFQIFTFQTFDPSVVDHSNDLDLG